MGQSFMYGVNGASIDVTASHSPSKTRTTIEHVATTLRRRLDNDGRGSLLVSVPGGS
jgi:hypothetical protein